MSKILKVRGWENFQHYKDRNPPWIKLHNELLDNYDFECLPDASKAHLICIWMLASRTENEIKFNENWIKKKIGATEKIDFKALIDGGFITIVDIETGGIDDASIVLASCNQTATMSARSVEERRGEDIKIRSKDIVLKSENDGHIYQSLNDDQLIQIEIDIDDLNGFSESDLIEDNFVCIDDYESFLAAGQNDTEDSKKKAGKKKADKLAEAEEAFSIFWQAGMRKSGDKKKALNKFILLAKQRKQTLTEFGEFLKSDIQQRIANNQFGFDSLLPTTYLNGERFNDEQQQTFTSDSGIDKTSSNQNSGESRSMQQARVAMAEQRRKFESS